MPHSDRLVIASPRDFNSLGPMTKRLVKRNEFCRLVATDLANRWLGDPSLIQQRLRRITGRRAVWVKTLASEIHQRFSKQGYCTARQLYRWIRKHPLVKRRFWARKSITIPSGADPTKASQYRWPVPRASGDPQLADLLCLKSVSLLDWLVLPHIRRKTKVDHYRRHSLRRRDGRERMIMQPRPVLMRVQRIIHREILSAIPIHEAAHAYRPGRTVHTCAAIHTNKFVVLKMDLSDFFGTITLRRVSAIFRKAGYDRQTALQLGRLCTAPSNDDSDRVSRLPQGAPTSPTLANAAAFQFDRRLAGLAACVGAKYTRYADDLFFSGDASFASRVERFATSVAVIAMEEGFTVNHRKTRNMFYGHRQSVLGITVNEGINSNRERYEQLKAILHNCVAMGWQSQNRANHPHFEQHLRGRIADVGRANSARAERLLKVFHRIQWD